MWGNIPLGCALEGLEGSFKVGKGVCGKPGPECACTCSLCRGRRPRLKLTEGERRGGSWSHWLRHDVSGWGFLKVGLDTRTKSEHQGQEGESEK